MGIGFYIFCFIGGLVLGALIHQSIQPKCKHDWRLLENNKVFRFRGSEEHHTGYVKFYECEHCKKLKREQIEID
jgi:hypothetical protein